MQKDRGNQWETAPRYWIPLDQTKWQWLVIQTVIQANGPWKFLQYVNLSLELENV